MNINFTIEENDSDVKTSLLKNNTFLIQKIKSLTKECLSIKSTADSPNFSDKINLSIKQFHQIIQSNIFSITQKITEEEVQNTEEIISIFLDNFENNSAHLLQTIQLQISEFLQLKEANVNSTAICIETSPNDFSNSTLMPLLAATPP